MRILVAYDPSEPSGEALRQARASMSPGDTLALCHVLPVPYDSQPFFPQLQQLEMLNNAELEATFRRNIAEHVAGMEGAAELELFIEQGAAYAEICKRAEAWSADRIVIGSHGTGGLTRALLGSVAERVVRHAPCSVLVARRAKGKGVVLAATDLSDPSLPAVEAGATEAARRKARLVVASAIDWSGSALLASVGAQFGASPLLPSDEVQAEMHEALATTLVQAAKGVGADAEARVLDGAPAAAIVHAAEELGAELVVVGTHGRTGLVHFALGSVAERVVRNAECSVLVVRMAPRAK